MLNRYAASYFASLVALSFITAIVPQASAQTQMSGSVDLWVPFLPDYGIGSVVNEFFPNNVIQPNVMSDSQNDVGLQYSLHGFYQFEGTRTMYESDWTYARIDGMSGAGTFADPNPLPAVPGGETVWLAGLDGTRYLGTADGGSMSITVDSDVTFATKYTGLRDRFFLHRWGLGEVQLGFGLDLMSLDQFIVMDARTNLGASAQFVEKLENDYIGCEIRSTWINEFGRVRSLLDVNFGFYDVDTFYTGNGIRNAGGPLLQAGSVLKQNNTAFTVDAALRLETAVGNVVVRPSVGMTYISEVGTIQHPQTEGPIPVPVSLGSEDAFMLNTGFELVY